MRIKNRDEHVLRDHVFSNCITLRFGVAALAFAFPVQGARAPPELAQAEREVLERSNAFRHSQGVAATAPNPALTAAAQEFAAFMARTDRYGHEADSRQPTQRAQAKGYAYCMVSENIAMQYSSAGFSAPELAQRFAQGWIDSPGHRRNLLDNTGTDTGVAIAHSARSDRYYAVQMFARPAALRVRFEIANRSSRDVRYRLADKSYALEAGVTRRHEECKVRPLSVSLPGQASPTSVQPTDGARYRVETTGAGLQLLSD